MTEDQPFGPDYIWNDAQEYADAMTRMRMTPYQMAREFRQVMGQLVDQYITPEMIAGESEEYVDWTPDTMAIGLIREEVKEVEEAYNTEDLEDGSEALLKELADLVYVVYGYAAFRGWNLDKAVARVHLSNMTKIDPVTGEVLRRDDGKVLKPKTYRSPYLKDLV